MESTTLESVTQKGEKRKVVDGIHEPEIGSSKVVKLETQGNGENAFIDLTSDDEMGVSPDEIPFPPTVQPEEVFSVSADGTVDLTSDDKDILPERVHSQGIVKAEPFLSSVDVDVIDLTLDDDEVQIVQNCIKVHADLKHIYDQLEIHARSQKELQQRGIVDLATLLERCDDFKDKKLIGVKRATQEALYHFCLWHEDFKNNKGNEEKVWSDHFTAGSFEKFEENVVHLLKESTNPTQDMNTKDLFNEVLKTLHNNESKLDRISPLQLEALHEYTTKLAFEDLSKTLLEKCQFNVKDLVRKVVKAILYATEDEQYEENILLVAGWTQAGKSTAKAVMACVCELLLCPLYIMTKGVAESKDLKQKLKFLKSGESKSGIESWWNDGQKNNTTDNVFADTACQITRVAKNIRSYRAEVGPNAKFLLIVDECDAMYRTEERSQKMEQAFDDLISLSPTFRVEISATFIPAALYLACIKGIKCNLFLLGTSDDYSGVTAMKPLQDESGKSIFLDDSIVPKHGVPYVVKKRDLHFLKRDKEGGGPLFANSNNDDGLESVAKDFDVKRPDHIPSTGRSVLKLCDHALSGNKNGVLLLDCTNNRVTAVNNVFEKATCIQNLYAAKGKKMVIVVVVGKGIYFRRPGHVYGRFVKNRKSVSDVIEKLDQESGLEVPIFVFGYSKMRRCISFRSEKRVPTHMVLSLGLAQSNETFIQALGRATFNGLNSVLKINGHEHVTVLTSENDLRMARSNQDFVKELVERTQCGISLKEALSRVEKRFPCKANYTLHTNRKTGQIKDLKDHLPGQDCFEHPKDVSGGTARSLLGDNALGLRVLEAMIELKEEARICEQPSKKIQEQYNVMFVKERTESIKLLDLRKILRKLKSKGLLETKSNDKWTAKNWYFVDALRLKARVETEEEHPTIM